MIIRYKDKFPQIEKAGFVADNATIIGDVGCKEGTSFWFNAVVRGDDGPIRLGENVAVEDFVMIHASPGLVTEIGDKVTLGHGAIIHSPVIEEGALIGMGAIVMDRAKIGKYSLVAAGSLVTEGSVFPERSLIMGSPAKRVGEVSKDHLAYLEYAYKTYVDLADEYKEIMKEYHEEN